MKGFVPWGKGRGSGHTLHLLDMCDWTYHDKDLLLVATHAKVKAWLYRLQRPVLSLVADCGNTMESKARGWSNSVSPHNTLLLYVKDYCSFSFRNKNQIRVSVKCWWLQMEHSCLLILQRNSFKSEPWQSIFMANLGLVSPSIHEAHSLFSVQHSLNGFKCYH